MATAVPIVHSWQSTAYSQTSKVQMNRIPAVAFLFGIALVAAGCNTTQQPVREQARSSSSASRSGNDEYDRSYQTESRRHHRRGEGGEAANDNWSSYDRASQQEQAEPTGKRARTQQHHNAQAVSAAPGQFDLYLLNLSWSPEFCHGHPNAAECAQHRAFTLHGLWPQNTDGTYPEDCSEAAGPAAPSRYADIYPDAGLLQHEWQTHGTCSGLGPDQFLSLARRAEQSIRIPAELAHPTQQNSLAPAQIITLFTQANPALPASSIAISCGNNYLSAVEVCMDKNLKPQSCTAIRTCGATQVRIPAPQ